MLFLKVELGQQMEVAGEYHRTSLGRILQQVKLSKNEMNYFFFLK